MTTLTPTNLPAWHTLQHLAQQPLPHLRELLTHDPQRSARMQSRAAGLTFDYSRQRITDEIRQALLALAQSSQLSAKRAAMFRGEPINATEGRAVLHVALRGAAVSEEQRSTAPWGVDISQLVQEQLTRMCTFAEKIRAGELRGFNGETITDVVNIGIGGSDLGPRMATEALEPLATAPVNVHYLSNPDAWSTYRLLRRLQPGHTLFIIASKTFTTQETLTIAASARRWLRDGGCPESAVPQQLAAVTAAPQRAAQYGVLVEHTFEFWDWVGGRYSVWSAIGLPLVIAIGAIAFRDFLAGAHAMDEHFRDAELERNLPVLAALIGIWNRNFLHLPTQLILPYAAQLAYFPAFIQQMEMESNGKRVHTDGTPCTIDTGAIVWGGLGIDAQHAYVQLLHQGTQCVPVDFIGVHRHTAPLPQAETHERVCHANLLAQARALAIGRDQEATRAALVSTGLTQEEAVRLAPHRTFPGNVPSSILWLDTITPHALGALIAFYEHKVFTEAAIWDIHAYDQWGVELGKQIAGEIDSMLQQKKVPDTLDYATRATLQWLTQKNN